MAVITVSREAGYKVIELESVNVAKITATAAQQGLIIGSNWGPIGAGIGAVVGAIGGFLFGRAKEAGAERSTAIALWRSSLGEAFNSAYPGSVVMSFFQQIPHIKGETLPVDMVNTVKNFMNAVLQQVPQESENAADIRLNIQSLLFHEGNPPIDRLPVVYFNLESNVTSGILSDGGSGGIAVPSGIAIALLALLRK